MGSGLPCPASAYCSWSTLTPLDAAAHGCEAETGNTGGRA